MPYIDMEPCPEPLEPTIHQTVANKLMITAPLALTSELASEHSSEETKIPRSNRDNEPRLVVTESHKTDWRVESSCSIAVPQA